jgi:hypothetical protein
MVGDVDWSTGKDVNCAARKESRGFAGKRTCSFGVAGYSGISLDRN